MSKSFPEKARGLARVGVLCGSMIGCGGGESTSGSSSGTDGAGESGIGLPGDLVECCWLVTYGSPLPCNSSTCYSYAEEACLPSERGTPCIDHQAADVDADGVISPAELQVACGQVCLDQGYDGTLPVDWSGMLPRDGAWDDPAGFVWNCSAIGTVNSSVVREEACTPSMFPDPPPFRVPTHIGFVARDDSTDQVRLNVLGTTVHPRFDGQANLALFDCSDAALDGGTCTLQLEGLSLALAEPVEVGEHTIPSAELMLAGVAETTVRFARCSKGTCTGHFQLGEPTGNPVGFGLQWVEHHHPTASRASHFIPLSNGAAGLGGLSSIDGLVTIDATSRTGELLLQGSGRDSFGEGAFASALFRLRFDLGPRTRRYTVASSSHDSWASAPTGVLPP